MQILDILDGTGSGDVDVSKCVEATAEHVIEGLHGSKLKINPKWVNPSGECLLDRSCSALKSTSFRLAAS